MLQWWLLKPLKKGSLLTVLFLRLRNLRILKKNLCLKFWKLLLKNVVVTEML